MRMILTCFDCMADGQGPTIASAEYNDSGVYEFTCPKGHRSVTVLQQQRYELLFEIACHAINDGYYREAVSSFTASLERFYEYGIRVMVQHTTNNQDLFNLTWKEVSNQSERQLGAFIFLWSAAFSEKPETLNSKWSGFRNKVIHKGSIPSRLEAVEYGEEIVRLMIPLRTKLTQEQSAASTKVTFQMLQEMTPTGFQGRTATGSMNFYMRGANGAQVEKLEDHLAQLKTQTRLMGIIPKT